MFYIVHTKKSFEVELWGTFDDLRTIYHTLRKFWNNEQYSGQKTFENRDQLISGFSYAIGQLMKGKN